MFIVVYFVLLSYAPGPLIADGIEIRHDGNIFVDPNMDGDLAVYVVPGEDNVFTCVIKDSEPSTEIMWIIGGEVFERAPGSLVSNSQVRPKLYQQVRKKPV